MIHFKKKIKELKDLKKLFIEQYERIENNDEELNNQLVIKQDIFDDNSLIDIYKRIKKVQTSIKEQIENSTNITIDRYLNVSENLLRIILEELQQVKEQFDLDKFRGTYVKTFEIFENKVVNDIVQQIETIFLKYQTQNNSNFLQNPAMYHPTILEPSKTVPNDIVDHTLTRNLKEHFRDSLDSFSVALQMYQEDALRKNNDWMLSVLNKLQKSIMRAINKNEEIHKLRKEVTELKNELNDLKTQQKYLLKKQADFHKELLYVLNEKDFCMKRPPNDHDQ
eukprot:TRINITY_DN217_c0_g1_i1.p1 TRINITY_DN217_c0_g1~~TRINITY_DN217_c0_g1_i1.p1  ORF type:complete len:280 (+),score=82.80 TRINITY_DN217_c0_g1_i1:42-881(+)